MVSRSRSFLISAALVLAALAGLITVIMLYTRVTQPDAGWLLPLLLCLLYAVILLPVCLAIAWIWIARRVDRARTAAALGTQAALLGLAAGACFALAQAALP